MAALFLVTGVSAQQSTQAGTADQAVDPSQVPSLVMENFTREHPTSSGTWSKEGDNHRVEFIDKESRVAHVIVYDRTGKVVRRDSELESVPGPINDYYNKNYPGETFRTWSTVDEKGEEYYFSNRKSETLRFDKEGKLVSPGDRKKTSDRQRGKSTKP